MSLTHKLGWIKHNMPSNMGTPNDNYSKQEARVRVDEIFAKLLRDFWTLQET